jgi:hypothetical protein
LAEAWIPFSFVQWHAELDELGGKHQVEVAEAFHSSKNP